MAPTQVIRATLHNGRTTIVSFDGTCMADFASKELHNSRLVYFVRALSADADADFYIPDPLAPGAVTPEGIYRAQMRPCYRLFDSMFTLMSEPVAPLPALPPRTPLVVATPSESPVGSPPALTDFARIATTRGVVCDVFSAIVYSLRQQCPALIAGAAMRFAEFISMNARASMQLHDQLEVVLRELFFKTAGPDISALALEAVERMFQDIIQCALASLSGDPIISDLSSGMATNAHVTLQKLRSLPDLMAYIFGLALGLSIDAFSLDPSPVDPAVGQRWRVMRANSGAGAAAVTLWIGSDAVFVCRQKLAMRVEAAGPGRAFARAALTVADPKNTSLGFEGVGELDPQVASIAAEALSLAVAELSRAKGTDAAGLM